MHSWSVDARYDQPQHQSERHEAFRPLDGTPQRDQWERERFAVRKKVREQELNGPIMKVAEQEAKTALAMLLAQQPDGLMPTPEVMHAHRVIYTRLEQCWVDACGGDYMVVQSKLAVLKLLSHVCGVDAALKASKQKLTNKVNSDDAIEHMRKLGVVQSAEPDTCEMPRRSVELAPPPSPENPPARRP